MDNKRNKTIVFIIFIFVVFVAVLGVSVVFKEVHEKYTIMKAIYKGTIASEITRDQDIQDIQYLLDINKKYCDMPITGEKIKRLKNYSIYTDKFTIKNFGSYNSPGGMCLGFSLYEKLNYMNQVSQLVKQISNTYENIEVSNLDKYDISELEYEGSITGNINSDTLYNLGIEYYDNKYQDFLKEEIDKKTAEALSIVNYLQKEANKDSNIYSFLKIKPNRYRNEEQAKLFEISKKNIIEQFEPSVIISKIYSSEPVIVGLHNVDGAHALMGYAYEQISQDIFKVYVSDSNIIVKDSTKYPKDKLKEVEEYNYDVENRVYILFVKDKDSGRWSYIYNPKINDIYI